MSLQAHGNSTALVFEADDVIVHADASRVAPQQPGPVHVAGSGYGNRRSLSPTAIGVTVAVHLVLAAGLFQLGAAYVKKDRQKIIAVDLAQPEPPPPTVQPQPPEVTPPQIVAVKPPIELPRPVPLVAAVEPDPAPVPVHVAPVAMQPASVPAPAAAPAPVAAGPQVIDGGNIDAQAISAPPPRIPVQSRRQREQGTVLLSVTVGTDGKVAQISVARSSGFPRLDDAAMDAVKRWRWAPRMINGQPAIVRGQIPIGFVVNEKS